MDTYNILHMPAQHFHHFLKDYSIKRLSELVYFIFHINSRFVWRGDWKDVVDIYFIYL